jgi:hypothetical protein
MSTPASPLPRSTRRRRAARRRALRTAIAVGAAAVVGGGVAGALLLRDDGDDGREGGQRAATTTSLSTTSSAPTTTAAAVTEPVPDDPVACLAGRYQLASQDFAGPVTTQFGPTQLEGGEAGRSIELLPDGTFRFADTGEEATRFTLLDTNLTGSATLTLEATGTYVATSETITIDVTGLTGTIVAVTDDGQTLDLPLPPDGGPTIEATFGFSPEAPYTCERDRVTVSFEVLTLVLDRQRQN